MQKLQADRSKRLIDDTESLNSDGLLSTNNHHSRNQMVASSSSKLYEPNDRVRDLQIEQQRLKQKMSEMCEDHVSMASKAKQIIKTSIDKLEGYKRERAELPLDSDGIYVIVEGEAKVVNKHQPDVVLR